MYFEIHIVDHCNLNCAGCSHFSPLVEENRFKSLDEFRRDVQQLYNLFKGEKIMLNILGGEPLLHPQLEEFLTLARDILGDENIIYLTTNGLLMKAKGEKFYNLLNSLKIRVQFTDYELNIDKTFIEKINTVIVTKRPIMRNISLDLSATQNPKKSYGLCYAHKCWMLKDGYLYNCPTSAYANDFERAFNFKFDSSLDDMGINIFTHSKEEILQFLRHSHNFCKYCNTYKARKTNFHQYKTEKNISEWVDTTEMKSNVK